VKFQALKIGNSVVEIQGMVDPQDRKGTLNIDGASVMVAFESLLQGYYRIVLDGQPYRIWVDRGRGVKHIFVEGDGFTVEHFAPRAAGRTGLQTMEEGPGEVTPPMPSVVVRILVKEGDRVEKGQGLVVVTAMKMETTLKAPYGGIVSKVNTEPEAKVMPGDILVEIEEQEDSHD